jgi:hypothetical protein
VVKDEMDEVLELVPEPVAEAVDELGTLDDLLSDMLSERVEYLAELVLSADLVGSTETLYVGPVRVELELKLTLILLLVWPVPPGAEEEVLPDPVAGGGLVGLTVEVEGGGGDAELVDVLDELAGGPGGEDEPLGFTVSLDGGPGGDEVVGGNPVGDTARQLVGMVGQTVTYLVT